MDAHRPKHPCNNVGDTAFFSDNDSTCVAVIVIAKAMIVPKTRDDIIKSGVIATQHVKLDARCTLEVELSTLVVRLRREVFKQMRSEEGRANREV